MLRHKINYRPYLQLMRLDKPVGTLLLLWPTLAALFLAAGNWPPLHLVLVFAAGTLLMRTAGCVINDLADRDFDGAVARTANRPLATRRIPIAHAFGILVLLLLASAALLLALNPITRWLALAGVAIAALYPFLKRWTYLPQVGLGAAFSWGLPMAYAAVQGEVPPVAWLLFIASLLWIVAYDTLYAMVDRDDDLKVGIRSTAILFGSADRLMVGLLQTATLTTLLMLASQQDYAGFFQAGVVAAGGFFVYQQYLIRDRTKAGCFAAFLNNVWVGFALFLGSVAEVVLASGTAPV
ncbi:MAG: 4-hydroxybenzoate octaprenyltransferase [Pseudomonadales bacterium]|nr:4-hydroxybenzoate octaprenyltransferase [Pseudomonadales bacterium]